jgi:hypothetical protein
LSIEPAITNVSHRQLVFAPNESPSPTRTGADKEKLLTVFPSPRRNANDLSIVLLVIDDRPRRETHDGERRHLLDPVGIGKGPDVLWVSNGDFELAPRRLQEERRRGR